MTQFVRIQLAKANVVVVDRSMKLAQSEAAGLSRLLKQIDARVLNVKYLEAGPSMDELPLCCIGWPYDIQASVKSHPALRRQGFVSSFSARATTARRFH
jgi:hypothetical protein